MSAHLASLPTAAAWAVSALVLGGAAITLIGAIGLVRLETFYRRVHAPTLGSSLGALQVLAGSILFFSISEGRSVLHEILIVLFLSVTTPVAFMLLVRAALERDREAAASDTHGPSSTRQNP